MTLYVLVLLIVGSTINVAWCVFVTPDPPLDEVYRRYFWNLPDGDFCTATANVHQLAVSSGGIGRQRVLAGCKTPNDLQDNMLYPLTFSELASMITASTSSSSAPDYALAAKMLQSLLPSAGTTGGVALLIDNSQNVSTNIIPYGWIWGALAALETLSDHAPVRALVLPEGEALDDAGMSLPSPLASSSPYTPPHNWSFATSTLPANGFEWTGLTATVVLMPAQFDWTRLYDEARYNRAAISSTTGFVSPQFSLQTVFPMYLFQYEQPNSEINADNLRGTLPESCLTQTIPNCLPIGGESVWSTTRKDQPSLLDDPDAGTRLAYTPQRTILVLISSTSTAPFHQHVPAASSTASAITAGLALMGALTSLLPYLRTSANASDKSGNVLAWEPTQVAIMFSTGDDYDLAGSGRFVRDLFQGSSFCSSIAQNKSQVSCLIPFTRTTNFTSLNLTNFSHIVHLDQLGTGRDVWHHFDSTDPADNSEGYDYKFNPQQQYVNQKFVSAGAKPSTEPQLPPGPLFAFYGSISQKNRIIQSQNRSGGATWLSRWSSGDNFTTLSTLSGFDSRFNNPRFQSSEDKAAFVNVTLVAQAVQIAASVIASILRDEYIEFKSSRFPAGFTVTKSTLDESLPLSAFQPQVDTQLVQGIFSCFGVDLACPFVTDVLQIQGLASPSPPNYYPSVFGFEAQTTLPQQLVYFAANYFWQDNGTTTTGCSDCPRYSLCLQGNCVRQQAFYHHAVAPALNFVRNGNIYFEQAPEAASSPSLGGSLSWGLNPRVLQNVWVESFWSNNLGSRTAMTASVSATWWMPFVGIVATLMPPLLFFAARRVLTQ